ncbi:hypothetical protein ABIB99_003967 [Bradyrhizobium sp. LA6.1]
MRKAHLLGVIHLFDIRAQQKWWVTPGGLRFAQPQG